MKIVLLEVLVTHAAAVVNYLPHGHPARHGAYEVWHCLERELAEAESKEGS